MRNVEYLNYYITKYLEMNEFTPEDFKSLAGIGGDIVIQDNKAIIIGYNIKKLDFELLSIKLDHLLKKRNVKMTLNKGMTTLEKE